MSEARFFHTEREGPTVVVTPLASVGSLAGEELRPELLELLAEFEQGGLTHAVIDLGQVAYFGTSMLEAMHAVWRRVRDAGGRMALCNVSDVAREILRISRFDTLWTIYNSRQDALAGVAAE